MCDTVERRVSFASTRERRLLFDEKRSGAVVASADFAVRGRFASEGEREADDAGAGAEIGDARRWRPVHASGDVRGEDERVDVASVPAARLQEEEASAEEHVQGLVGVGRHRVGRARAGAGRGIGGSVRGETALERGGLAAREEAEGGGDGGSVVVHAELGAAKRDERAEGVGGDGVTLAQGTPSGRVDRRGRGRGRGGGGVVACVAGDRESTRRTRRHARRHGCGREASRHRRRARGRPRTEPRSGGSDLG